MLLFVDTEFDTPTGTLISLGIVSEDRRWEFYEVLPYDNIEDEWVKENVIPILQKEPISLEEFHDRLAKFLGQFARLHFIANHVNDMVYTGKAMDMGKGKQVVELPTIFELNHELSGKGSKMLHNALFDARATLDDWERLNGVN